MEKYFVTYQPQKVAEELKIRDYVASNSDYKQIKKEFGYDPIFFIPLENKLDFLIKDIISSPSMPEVMIITKLHEYDYIDAAKWYELKGKEKNHKSIRANKTDNLEKEIIARQILKSDVVKVISIYNMVSDEIRSQREINMQNITRVLPSLQIFWDELENYFQSSDERVMIKFVRSEHFGEVLEQYNVIMNEHKMGQSDAMKWFRNKMTDVSNKIDWF